VSTGERMSGLTILALVFVLCALLAARLDRLSITASTAFVVIGSVLGPAGASVLEVSNETTLAITEITLALLFVWTLFGALFVGPVLAGQVHLTAVGYAVLSLTRGADASCRALADGARHAPEHLAVQGGGSLHAGSRPSCSL
jgi:Kef-type K+ transport system membrane component KefB